MSDDKPEPKKPAAKKPAAAKPAAAKPAAKKPATAAAKATAAKPATAKKPAAAKKPPATKPVPVVADTTAPAETQPTEVIAPAATAPAAASTTAAAATSDPPTAEPEVVIVAAPKRKRRIWPFVLIGIVVLIVIALIAGYFIGENYARKQAIDTITQRVVGVLHVTDPKSVTVDIGDGSVLFQALAGKLDEVTVQADDVTFGELSGAATLQAKDVPLDANAKTKSLDITFTLPEDQVASQLTSVLGDIKPDSVLLEEPEIVVNTTLDLFFFKLPVGLGLEPSAEEGRLIFTPTTVTLGEEDYTPAELRKELGDLAEPFLAVQNLCVSDQLPQALTITDVDVKDKALVLKIEGDQVALGGPGLSTNGTCDG